MTRVLHLVDFAAAEAGPSLLADLGRVVRLAAGHEHQVVLVGPRWAVQMAADCGAGRPTRVPAAFHRATLALPALRRCVPAGRGPEMVMAWTGDARRAAGWLWPRLPVVGRPEGVLGVEDGLVDGTRRRRLRGRWHVPDEALVVGLLADRRSAAAAMPAAVALGLVRECLGQRHSADASVCLLVHPQTQGLSKTMAMVREVGWRSGLIQDPVVAVPWEVLPAVDVALLPDAVASDGLALWATVCGAAVVAGPGGRVTGRLAAGGGALCCDPAVPRQVASALLQLVREPGLRAAMTEAAWAIADRGFSRSAVQADLASLFGIAVPAAG